MPMRTACGGYRGVVLSAPVGLPQDVLVSALGSGWRIAIASMTYRAVGFGSHHWEVIDAAGTRWFVTADELATKRYSLGESLDSAFDRLCASLAAARDLADCGRTFVVAPLPADDGAPLVRANDQFGVAVYPFIKGHSFEWGEFSTPAHRCGTLDLIVAIHTAPAAASRHAMTDGFGIPHRDELEVAIGSVDAVDRADAVGRADTGTVGTVSRAEDCGPYARPMALLLRENAEPVRRLLARYDELAALGRSQPARQVLTHGEPHPGNTMLTSAGWRLIDWDTVLVAPPERDLWSLDPGDGSVLRRYAEATGVTPLPSMLELHRIRWDLADLAVDVSRFRRQHTGSLDDDQSWNLLRSMVARISG
jgi:spectinomycin phosphotransferase/16S rRNA (guanine(1405)-N(7))-methyltransferase